MAEKRKPDIRFKGFTDDWEQRKLGEILQERNIRTSDFENNPLYSLTIESGVTPKTDRYERSSLVTKTEDLFKVVKPNEFVTNPMNLRFGALGYNTNTFSVSVSGYYDVFSIDDDKCSGFWNSYFKTPIAMKIFDNVATGSLIEKRRVKYSTLQQLDFYMPRELSEKIKIGTYMDALDNLITLHQRKYDKLINVKKFMLQKMFPQSGSNVPEIRFAGFTDVWEQRKFGDITEIKSALRVHKEEWTNTGVPFYRSSDVMSAINGTTNTKAFISEELYEKLSSTSGKLEKGDVLVTGGGSVGNPYIVPNNEPLYTKDADLLWIKNNEKFDSYFVYEFFFSPVFRTYLESISHVGTIAHYTITQLADTPIALPSIEEQKQIGVCFKNLDNLITLHHSKLEKLKNIKKSMLEKMFI